MRKGTNLKRKNERKLILWRTEEEWKMQGVGLGRGKGGI